MRDPHVSWKVQIIQQEASYLAAASVDRLWVTGHSNESVARGDSRSFELDPIDLIAERPSARSPWGQMMTLVNLAIRRAFCPAINLNNEKGEDHSFMSDE
jgi:hypothetical protein